ncbi:phosphoribosylanthranilate isomerase [Selenihalanaerobacter shriftii]|nr:phosphoribosylanthranilate isomerase [Selenihalanaerobacter shriftii]
MTRVKICGITNLADAKQIAKVGVDSLGFIFANSPRQVKPTQVKEIINELPPFINTVGVFANEEMMMVKEIAKYCGLDTLQFHGNESPQYCQCFEEQKIIKAFRIKDEIDLEKLSNYNVDGYLLDTYDPNHLGGTGQTFNWNLALEAKKLGPVILAGGINSKNISTAIKEVSPYGVDISSGVERAPGLKDLGKVEEVFTKIRGNNNGK